MNALQKSADEIAALLRSDSASEELKQAVRLFSEVNVGQAMSEQKCSMSCLLDVSKPAMKSFWSAPPRTIPKIRRRSNG
jgi:hypothetical protein